MTQVNKIDSNITGLAYAEEAAIGVLPGSPAWYRLNPNSYSDFGGELKTVAPNPINPSRQRRKGVITDLDASGGFNHNLTFSNLSDLMQGFMFADMRRKGRMTVTGVASTGYTTSAVNSHAVAGALVKGTGFGDSANNDVHIVTAISGSEVQCSGLVLASGDVGTLDVVGRQAATGDLDVNVAGDFPVITSTALDFTTLGLVIGQWIYVGGDTAGHGFTNDENNGFKRVRRIAANALTLDKSFTAMVTEANTTSTVRLYYGDVLRNETGTLIKRRTYHLERTLGAPDDAQPTQVQSEVLKGAVANEFKLNIPSADLLNVDMSFMGTDNEQRTGAEGPLQTSVQIFPAADEYNTSSDVGRIRMSIVSANDEAPQALFAYVTEANISINNNVKMNKAVGVLGAFDITAGTFEVSGDLTAYFSNVTAIQAVRANESVTLDISFIKDNTGLIFDLPLISLGNGRLNVEIDEPIMLPLSKNAATGEDIDPNLDHTLLITYFNYLPSAAE